MTLFEDMKVIWKQKEVFEFDMNNNDVIFDDYESGEGAITCRGHESVDEEEKISDGNTSSDGSQLSDNHEHNKIKNGDGSGEETVEHLKYYLSVRLNNCYMVGILTSRLWYEEAIKIVDENIGDVSIPESYTEALEIDDGADLIDVMKYKINYSNTVNKWELFNFQKGEK